MENNKTIIKFLRSSKPENSLDDAVKKLNLLENKQGQPILVLYYTETGLIDCLHAIGIKDGIGPETYSIISSNSSLLVSRVGLEEKDIPDVTEPLYDQVFIYRNDNTDQTFWVIDKKGKRELIEIEKKTDKKETEPYLIVKETVSGAYWWINGYEVKRAFDFNTRACSICSFCASSFSLCFSISSNVIVGSSTRLSPLFGTSSCPFFM